MDLGQQRTPWKCLDSSISSKMVFGVSLQRLMAPSGKVALVLLLKYVIVIVKMERVRDQGGCRERLDNSPIIVMLKTFQNLPGLLSHGNFIHLTFV